MRTQLTRHRSLRSGRSVWAEYGGLSTRSQTLRRDAYADVAIVGAGISGALMAHSLVARGLSVILLERKSSPLRGSTMASTALLQFELDVPLSVLIERVGEAAAQRAWQRSWRGVQSLRRLVASERIRCSWRNCNSLYLAGSAYGSRALRAEHIARTRAGLPGHVVTAGALSKRFGIKRTAAIETAGAASANPAQLTAGLLRRSVARGLRVCTETDVQQVSADADRVVLGIVDGPVVVANFAVFCTGYEVPAPLPMRDARRKSTWAIATAPLKRVPEWLRRTVLWEASDPYLYLRCTPDGRLLAGGEDEKASERHLDDAAMLVKSKRIAANVHAMLPSLAFRVTHRWGGVFGESSTGLPTIDAIPGLRRCYSVAGFGGNGITFSMIAAEIVTAAIVGKADRDARLFRAR